MKQLIFVATAPSRHDILANFIYSMRNYDGKYPMIIYNDFNRNKFTEFIKNSSYDEVLVLHDSMEIKDYSLFHEVFEVHKGESITFNNNKTWGIDKYFLHGFGKFKTEVIKKIEFPIFKSYKDEAAWEGEFGKRYIEAEGCEPRALLRDEDMADTKKFVRKFDRLNMVIENKYFIKYKAHWSYKMCEEAKGDR